jgi:hypothetical protein
MKQNGGSCTVQRPCAYIYCVPYRAWSDAVANDMCAVCVAAMRAWLRIVASVFSISISTRSIVPTYVWKARRQVCIVS